MGEDYYNPLSMWLTQPRSTPSLIPQTQPRLFPMASASAPVAAPALPTYGVVSAYGPDNIDVGSSWKHAAGSIPATSGIDWGSSKFWLGDRNQPGAAGLALGGANFLMNSLLGWQQLGVAKDSLAASKEQFAKNFAAQQKTINTQLEDRQRARVASNAGAYQSVGDYMAQNRV